jgi:DNA-binding protein YbaB
MFDQLKQLQQLKELKDALEQERKEVEQEGVKVLVNGKMEIEGVKLNPELSVDRQEELVKVCFNEAIREIQKTATQKMMSMQQ